MCNPFTNGWSIHKPCLATTTGSPTYRPIVHTKPCVDLGGSEAEREAEERERREVVHAFLDWTIAQVEKAAQAEANEAARARAARLREEAVHERDIKREVHSVLGGVTKQVEAAVNRPSAAVLANARLLRPEAPQQAIGSTVYRLKCPKCSTTLQARVQNHLGPAVLKVSSVCPKCKSVARFSVPPTRPAVAKATGQLPGASGAPPAAARDAVRKLPQP